MCIFAASLATKKPTQTLHNYDMNNRTTKQILSLLGVFVLFYILLSIAIMIFTFKGVEMRQLLIVSNLLQNLALFIIPSVIVARIFNPGKTWQVLKLNRLPGVAHVAMMLLIYFAAMPIMNYITIWNESWQLPESLAWIREMENDALMATQKLMQMNSIGDLIVILLTVGLLTGIGEEMLFRGTIQRIFSEGKVNTHIAVWCSAFIFSALHFQLFGFIPRMLLGAFFGYLYVWSGSLWLPILAHALNNSLSTLTYYDAAIDTLPWIGNHPTPTLAIVSAIATALMVTLYIMCIVRKRVRD